MLVILVLQPLPLWVTFIFSFSWKVQGLISYETAFLPFFFVCFVLKVFEVTKPGHTCM